NTIDITQLGSNDASVDIFGSGGGSDGDDNEVTITQDLFNAGGGTNSAKVEVDGDDNIIGINQLGNNLADIKLLGSGSGESDNNLLNIDQQDGSGGQNSITVTIYGDDNNLSGPFTGDASIYAGSLLPGDLFQNGSSNSITLDVGSTSGESNGNLFAFQQTGSSNTITGSMTGGDANQAVVVQVGNFNATTFAQVGSFNNLGVSQ
ncbi:MAG: hypothetical protein HRU31_06530, partial [Rhodobacteraceae bacterium]|nr:hypothetical protein [Paracoccaceae bacterium]